MKNRWYLLVGMLVLALTFGLLAACSDDEADVWTEITEQAQLDQLGGTWKGSYSNGTQTLKQVLDEDEEGSFIAGMLSLAGIDPSAISITGSIEITTTIAEGQQTINVRSISTFSGSKITELLEFYKEFDSSAVIEGNSLIETWTQGPIPLSLSGMEGVQINQDGTKVLLPAGMMDDEAPEIILTR
ncbi:MAG: hypothetical protein LBP93_05585 [Treponema sp.]|jgi:hypothetical protein|nr:hypothetical protein [Treponema sp.]